jgi:hypothetical protein
MELTRDETYLLQAMVNFAESQWEYFLKSSISLDDDDDIAEERNNMEKSIDSIKEKIYNL